MSEPKGGPPAVKRRRISKEIIGIQHKEPDAEVSLDVDILILDYTAYQATRALLDEARHASSKVISADQNLSMTDSFLAMFKAKHSAHQVDAELDFRILLLKFTTLFLRCLMRNQFSPGLEHLRKLRKENQDRARAWTLISSRMPTHSHDTTAFDAELPLSPEELKRNRADILNSLNIIAEDQAYGDAFYGTAESLALLDVLPVFMHVSAMRNSISGSIPTQQWMVLTGEFILQACLEQYRVKGASGSDAIDEAFAWGCCGQAIHRPETNGHDEIEAMFKSDSGPNSEVQGWAQVKQSLLATLIPTQSSASLVTHLESVAAARPLIAFQAGMLEFLGALLESMPKPILVQLEQGNLDGFTSEQTTDFLQKCGLPAAWPEVSV